MIGSGYQKVSLALWSRMCGRSTPFWIPSNHHHCTRPPNQTFFKAAALPILARPMVLWHRWLAIALSPLFR